MKKIPGILLAGAMLFGTLPTTMAKDAENRLEVTQIPSGMDKNDDFAVEIRTPGGAWQKAEAYNAVIADGYIVQGDTSHQIDASIVDFAFEGNVEMKITYTKGDVGEFRIRPDAKEYTYERDGNTIYLDLEKPDQLLVQVDDKDKEQLHVFANEIVDYEKKYGFSKDDPNVIYFGPGVHDWKNNPNIKHIMPDWLWYDYIFIPSDTTVFIDRGAVVKASVIFMEDYVGYPENVVKGSSNSRLVGGGVLWNRHHNTRDGVQATDDSLRMSSMHGTPGSITIKRCDNITVDGILELNSGQYGFQNVNTRNLTINNVKVFDCMQWGDGINSYGCGNVKITDCFVRSSDDCIPIYAGKPDVGTMDSSDFYVENCTLYADMAHAMYVGRHGGQDPENRTTIENITFKNIYVLEAFAVEGFWGTMAVEAGDENIIKNVLFENIEVEDFRNSALFWVDVSQNGYNPNPGYLVDGVTFRNINYNGANKNTSTIRGFDEDRRVKNVTFENLTINGQPIVDPDDGNIRIKAYSDNIVFSHDSIEGVYEAEAEPAEGNINTEISITNADLVVKTAPNPITVDGNPDDWKDVKGTIRLPADGSNNMSAPTWTDNDDMSAEVKFTYDAEKFYLYVDVTDDQHTMVPGTGYWEGDSVQLAFKQAGGEYGPEFGFSSENIFYKQASYKYGSDDAIKDAEIVTKQTDHGVFYEISMPWSTVFEEAPENGLSIGFLINENDGAGRVGWMEWGEGIASGKVTEKFRMIAFDKPCTFEDVGDHWAYDDINFMYKKGILAGKSETRYAPEDQVTRAEFISLMLRIAGMAGNRYNAISAYEDVKAEDWFVRAAQSAAMKGLFAEEMTPNNQMLPQKPITREEMAYVAVKTLEFKNLMPEGSGTVSFADRAELADWAKDYVEKAAQTGILSGDDTGMFRPGENVTRAETASVMARIYMLLHPETERD